MLATLRLDAYHSTLPGQRAAARVVANIYAYDRHCCLDFDKLCNIRHGLPVWAHQIVDQIVLFWDGFDLLPTHGSAALGLVRIHVMNWQCCAALLLPVMGQ